MAARSKRRRTGQPMADDSHSPLWLLLIQKFAIGRLTAVEVQELAATSG